MALLPLILNQMTTEPKTRQDGKYQGESIYSYMKVNHFSPTPRYLPVFAPQERLGDFEL
jgi:hypothetical protein